MRNEDVCAREGASGELSPRFPVLLPSTKLGRWAGRIVAALIVAVSVCLVFCAVKENIRSESEISVVRDLLDIMRVAIKYSRTYGALPPDFAELARSTQASLVPEVDPWGRHYKYFLYRFYSEGREGVVAVGMCLGSDGKRGGQGAALDIAVCTDGESAWIADASDFWIADASDFNGR